MEEVYNILYVDDEYQNLVSFKACFRKYYNVLTANSAREAIKILKETTVHLIITDQRMPEVTGTEFLEEILNSFPDAIRMILTGFSSIDSIITAINTGRVFHYVTKPWDEQELKAIIDNALAFYKTQKINKQLLEDLKNKVEEQDRILSVFKKFVPEEVVHRALKLNDESSLFEGEYRDVTVLFCDIRNFTALSEKISPKQVVKLLNSYYTIFSSIITKYHGCVNQYVGDEIFAVFGAPATVESHEKNAVFAALEMIEALKNVNDLYKETLGSEIVIGIGINSGCVVAGNLGCEDKLEYSITGDTVNTGKRIENLTQDQSNKILISDSTYSKVKDFIKVIKWDPVEVKGKKNKILVYEVIGKSESS